MSELLVRKARKGDAESFCRLMDMHLQTMYKIAWSYLKNEEDVAHDAAKPHWPVTKNLGI